MGEAGLPRFYTFGTMHLEPAQSCGRSWYGVGVQVGAFEAGKSTFHQHVVSQKLFDRCWNPMMLTKNDLYKYFQSASFNTLQQATPAHLVFGCDMII